jgi:hypothetical protein
VSALLAAVDEDITVKFRPSDISKEIGKTCGFMAFKMVSQAPSKKASCPLNTFI